MTGINGMPKAKAASNVEADKKMEMQCAMVDSIFLLMTEVNLLQASR